MFPELLVSIGNCFLGNRSGGVGVQDGGREAGERERERERDSGQPSRAEQVEEQREMLGKTMRQLSHNYTHLKKKIFFNASTHRLTTQRTCTQHTHTHTHVETHSHTHMHIHKQISKMQ